MGKTWKGSRAKGRGGRRFTSHVGGEFRPRERHAVGQPALMGSPIPPLSAAAPTPGPQAAEQRGEGDKNLTCIDCRTLFVFNAGEQAFYRERNLSEPKRCKPCRELKKARNQKSG